MHLGVSMEYRVEVSASADRDVDEILTYIAGNLANPSAASRFADDLDKKYAELESHPYIFELSRNDYLAKMGYHRFIVGNYVALYRIEEEKHLVVIARIFYGKREYEKCI